MVASAKTLVCIEDDRETAALIAEEFTERGFRMLLAEDGAAGLDTIVRETPDLVLCDVSMPVMNGFDLLERLAASSPRHATVPFVFLTALGDREHELRGRRLGADDYVVKPIDFDILAAIIDARLARSARDELAPGTPLSTREMECLTWAARGKTSAEIAQIIGTSKRTVDFHVEMACRKLNVATRIQAAVRAVSERLIEP